MLNIGGELAFVLQDIDYSSKKDLLDKLRAIRDDLKNYDEKKVLENVKNHDDNSSLLVGYLKEDDDIKIRKK